MKWEKEIILTEEGSREAILPFIISASRATDIPAFYPEWFIQSLKKGYCKWINPFNGKAQYISFKKMKHIVFWTKNPKPILKHIKYFDDSNLSYYFHFTLNDYDTTIEPNLPVLSERIETFKELSQLIGKERVVWRFDPLLLTDCCNVDDLLNKLYNLGNQIYRYTNKLVFSFADISIYRSVCSSLKKRNINYLEFDTEKMLTVAKHIKRFNREWNIITATCCEKVDLEEYGISHNKCIDDDLIRKLTKDSELLEFLGSSISSRMDSISGNTTIGKNPLKDKGQRKECGCILSKDIGRYNTCPHLCPYCYANSSSGKTLPIN